jgi:hypothetical protein
MKTPNFIGCGMAATLVCVVGSVASPIPVGQREYDFVYDRIERQEVYDRSRYDYQLGGYTRIDSSWSLFPFASHQSITDKQIALYGFASESYRASQDRRGRMYAALRGGFSAKPFSRVSINGQYSLDERKARDPLYTGKKWRGFAGDIDLAFAQYTTPKLTATVGRFSSFWGIRKSLVLGANTRLDGFGYAVKLGRLTFSYRFGQLAQDSIGSDTTTQWPNRYLAAHRLDLHASSTLRVGIFESVVFGGPGRSPEFSYLNPIIFYHGSQLNENVNDNTIVGADFTWKPRRGLKLYGQIALDDIQLDNKNQGDEEPAEYALTIGAYGRSCRTNFDARVEYTRVTNRTYNQILPRNRYVNGHDLIADVAGNDYDLVSAELSKWYGENLAASVKVSYRQQGEGRIVASFDQPWLDTTGDYSEPFPTGTVERTFSVSTGIRGFVNSVAFVDFECGWSRMVNYDHHAGDKRSLPFVEGFLSLYYSKIVGLD